MLLSSFTENIVLLESADGYILCRDARTGLEFRIVEEMTGWEVEIVNSWVVAELG